MRLPALRPQPHRALLRLAAVMRAGWSHSTGAAALLTPASTRAAVGGRGSSKSGRVIPPIRTAPRRGRDRLVHASWHMPRYWYRYVGRTPPPTSRERHHPARPRHDADTGEAFTK